MDKDLISIIMPTYNCGKYISESIQSVINQTYTKWELIIVDDCSTDDTKDIIKLFHDNRICYVMNEKNKGAAISRNLALSIAKGEWIAFLDSDDIWKCNKLEKQISFMKKNNYSFTCTYCEYIDEESNFLGKIDMCPKHITKFMNYMYNWIGALTVMYHVPLKKRNDYALWFEVFKQADCYCLAEVLAMYRVRNQSVSHDKLSNLIKAHYKLYRKGEHYNIFKSCLLTACNLMFGVIRKIIYVRNYKNM